MLIWAALAGGAPELGSGGIAWQNSYRIAHFSDFHLMDMGADFQRALAMIDDAIGQKPGHIIITGDIVECGKIHVYSAFLDEIKDRGWARPDPLSVVPGNHDVFPWSTRKRAPLSRPSANFERLFVQIVALATQPGDTPRISPISPISPIRSAQS